MLQLGIMISGGVAGLQSDPITVQCIDNSLSRGNLACARVRCLEGLALACTNFVQLHACLHFPLLLVPQGYDGLRSLPLE